MPLGSSSDAPVINPGPSTWRSFGVVGCLTSGSTSGTRPPEFATGVTPSVPTAELQLPALILVAWRGSQSPRSAWSGCGRRVLSAKGCPCASLSRNRGAQNHEETQSNKGREPRKSSIELAWTLPRWVEPRQTCSLRSLREFRRCRCAGRRPRYHHLTAPGVALGLAGNAPMAGVGASGAAPQERIHCCGAAEAAVAATS